MCGLFAVITKNPNSHLDYDRARRAFNQLTHRGPERQIIRTEKNKFFLAQGVLPITSQSDFGLETYNKSASGRYEVFLNGEIYNYKDLADRYLLTSFDLRFRSDTSVLCELLDVLGIERLIPLLNGMYVFFVLDNKAGVVHVVRDTIGEKNLFLYENDSILLMASEISALWNYNDGLEVDYETLCDYLHTRHFTPRRSTNYKRVTSFQPGGWIQIMVGDGTQKIVPNKTTDIFSFVDRSYYDYLDGISEPQLVDDVVDLFEANARLIAPNIEYASIFSGGIDSSLASFFLMNCESPPKFLHCLNFMGKDSIAADINRFDQVIGKHIGRVDVSIDDFSDELVSYYSAHSGILPTHSFPSQAIVAKNVAASGHRVLIGGDGADELFGGYASYEKARAFSGTHLINPSPYSGLTYLSGAKVKPSPTLMSQMEQEWHFATNIYGFIDDQTERNLQAAMLLDSFVQLENVGLRCADAMSMKYTVEGRGFFVTRELVRLATNLPLRYKLNRTQKRQELRTKYLLKKIFIKAFGNNLLFEKQGFSGFPNESGHFLLLKFPRLAELFNDNRNKYFNSGQSLDRSSEWKLMNISMFEYFGRH